MAIPKDFTEVLGDLLIQDILGSLKENCQQQKGWDHAEAQIRELVRESTNMSGLYESIKDCAVHNSFALSLAQAQAYVNKLEGAYALATQELGGANQLIEVLENQRKAFKEEIEDIATYKNPAAMRTKIDALVAELKVKLEVG